MPSTNNQFTLVIRHLDIRSMFHYTFEYENCKLRYRVLSLIYEIFYRSLGNLSDLNVGLCLL